MRKITAYEIVSARTRVDFLRLIDEGLAKGWQPYGSPFAMPYLDSSDFAQAMVRYADTKEEQP